MLDIPESYHPWSPGEADPRFLAALARRDPSAPVQIAGFPQLAATLAAGFTRVTYLSHQLDSGALYWLRDDHARALAGVLGDLAYFGLVLTRLESRGLHLLAEEVDDDTTIDELLIKHASGDEVTVLEAEGVAALCAALRVRTLHLWAAEFDHGALDALQRALVDTDTRTLIEADVCLTTLPEPEDRRALPRLEPLLRRNRGG